jgi:3-oxoadipate enol-lactonase
MPSVRINGTELHYEDTGGRTRETLVFSHGLLLDLRMFDAQAQHFADRYRVVRYDHRGQGGSARTKARSIDLETLYEDAAALIEHLEIGPCHFAGLSMGGYVGLRLLARRPGLLRSVILLDTSAGSETDVARYRLLNLVARWLGPRPVAKPVMKMMFGRTFLVDPGRADERELWRERLIALDRGIWRAVNGVIEREGVADELGPVEVPTLIIVGEEDLAAPPVLAERLHAALPGSQLVRIPRCGHSSTIEAPEAVNRAIEEFLAGLPH